MVFHSLEGSNASHLRLMRELPIGGPSESNDALTSLGGGGGWGGGVQPNSFLDFLGVQNEKIEVFYSSGGLTNSQTNQHPLNQVETSEASYQAISGGARVKLTPDQVRENKRKSDHKYKEKKKRAEADLAAECKRLKPEIEVLNAENKMLKNFERTAAELAAKCERLKAEIEVLNAENKMLKNFERTAAALAAKCERLEAEIEVLNAENKKFKELPTCDGQLLIQAPQRQREDTCTAQSASKQLDHPSDSVQVGDLEMDLQYLHKKIPINAVAYVTENQTIKLLMKEIDEDDQSNVCFSDFTGLDGERVKIGKYNFPLSLRPVVERIIACYGDVSATSKMNIKVVEVTYILFCASVKEMGDLQLEEVTKDRILKWGDTIKDALRINFKADFAMDHLKKIAYAYIGRIESHELEKMTERISKLEANLNTRKEELAKRKEQSKKYMDAAEFFNGKSLNLFP